MEITTIPIYDRDAFLERLTGDEDLAGIVIESFLKYIPNQIQMLKESLDQSDVSGSERQAHTINGAAANVGGEALRGVAFEIETLAKDGKLNAAKEHLAELEVQFDQLKEAMSGSTVQ